MGHIDTLGKARVGLFINSSYARSGRGVTAFCGSIPCLPAENSQTLGPKTKIASLCQGWRRLSPGFPRRLRGGARWGFKALAIAAPAKMKKHCSYSTRFCQGFHIMRTVISVLSNGLLPHEHITLACHGVRGMVPLKPLMA
jgi:hypothetical protein